MTETIQGILSAVFLLVSILLIILAATRQYFPGKAWFILFLLSGLITTAGWMIPTLLFTLEIDFDPSKFYETYGLALRIIGIIGFCSLIPFVLAMQEPDQATVNAVGSEQAYASADTSSPLYGVAGWLKFFVIVNLYIQPVIFGIRHTIGFIGIAAIADKYPGLLVVGVIEAAVGLFFIIKWILIGRQVRDMAPRVVHTVKKWLIITLIWSLISIPLAFLSGLAPEDLALSSLKGFVTAIISFTIWYSYFSVSKRVKTTFPEGKTSADI